MEFNGNLCLYPRSAWPPPPWDEVDPLFEKVAGWYEQHHAGWPNDPGDLDLERYFEKHAPDVLIAYDDLDNLIGNRLNVKFAGQPGAWIVTRKRNLFTSSPSHNKRDRRHEDKGSMWGAGVDIGLLRQPVNDWDSFARCLDGNVRAELLRLAKSNAHGIVLAKYARLFGDGPNVGAIALRLDRPVGGSAEPILTTLQVGNRIWAKVNRQGMTRDLLRNKSIAIIGCGSIGSFLAEQLARSGVGQLNLIDGDRLRHGNCIRHLADTRFVNLHKPLAIRNILVERELMDPHQIRINNQDLTAEEAVALFGEHDLVIDATADSRIFSLFEYLGDTLRHQWVTVALHRGGNIIRVDRLGYGTLPWEKRLPRVHEPDEIGVIETGCGDPVSPTPPASVLAAASLACRFAIDTLQPRARRLLQDSIVETLLTHNGDGYETLGIQYQ
jgi:hypothetical protein